MDSNRKSYKIILIITVVISAIFQFGNIGWIVILLGLFIGLAYIFHLVAWLRWLRDSTPFNQLDRRVFILNNTAFLIGNIFNFDVGDTSTHMFFFQLTDPHDFLIWIGLIGQIIWLVTFLVYFLYRVVNWFQARSVS